MQIYPFESFDHFLKAKLPEGLQDSVLTIGNFDGVHLGHQKVLEKLTQNNRPSVVFTFSNHPSSLLYQKDIPLLTAPAHRLSLLEKAGVDFVIAIPFDLPFSRLSAENFVRKLQSVIPFSCMILGHDAAIGYERKGSREILSLLAMKLGFSLEYVEPQIKENKVVSSSLIRKYIQEGNLQQASVLLGRSFSLKGDVVFGSKKGSVLGFKTANLDVKGMCLPPFGVWVVEIELEKAARMQGVANLGYAPTMHAERLPFLEVHIFNFEQEIYQKEIEIFFLKHLRNEKKFDSIEALKNQIKEDILISKSFFRGKLSR